MNWNWLWLLSGLCVFGLPAEGQTNGDWRSLDRVPVGMPISVVVRTGRRSCEFIRITDSAFACERRGGRLLVIPRNEVREVRRERPGNNRTIRGALIGAGVGALVFGAPAQNTNDAETRVASPFLGVLFGAFIGGVIGSRVHEHGVILYSRN